MKKILLVVLFIMSCAHAFPQSANGGAVYVIKNGKLETGVEVVEMKNRLKMEQGDGYLSFKKENFKQQLIRFKLSHKKVYDLKNMNLVIEYQLPETALCDTGHYMNFFNNTCAPKEASTITVCAYASNGYMRSRVFVDGKFNPNSAKDFVKYDGFAYVGDSTKANLFDLCYMDKWEWRVANTDSVPGVLKVKNLYYERRIQEKTPFFSSQFDAFNVKNEYWNADETYQTGAVLSSNSLYNDPTLKILYMNQRNNFTGTDRSGYLASEIMHGLYIASATNYIAKWLKKTDTLFLRKIVLPKRVSEINVESLIRVEKVYESTQKEPIPIYYSFDDGKTMNRVFQDSIPYQYTKVENNISVPADAKTMTLTFAQGEYSSYIVNNLIISAVKFNPVKTAPKKKAVAGKK